jgi:hypothetical protein
LSWFQLDPMFGEVPALFGFTDIMSSCFVLFHFSENSVPRPTSDWSGTITQIRVSVAVKVMRSSLARWEFRGTFDLAESSLILLILWMLLI